MRSISLLLVLATLGCSHASLTGEPRYGRAAEDDYKSGQQELKSRNYVEATKFFEHVRTKYPFSRYAALSELRLADVKYDQDRFIEAGEAYQAFVRLRPGHEEVDYAAFRVALSHWKDGPSDFFLYPPPFEKDQTQVKDAAKAFEDFLKKYPASTYRPEAERLLARARHLLVEHEWYVAQFYAKRNHWAGAANRLEGLVKNYPDSPREPAALLDLAAAYLKLDERFRAQQALQRLIVEHPKDPRRPEAERLLASLR